MPNGDFVSRQWLIDEYHRRHQGPPGGALKMIEEAPAADVEPVIPGRWVSKEGIYGVVYCSICDFELKIDNTPHCPNCGAKMLPEPPMELVDELDETERGANGFGSSGR